MTSKILVAIDLEHRDNSLKALGEAGLLARCLDAEIHVCYVLADGFYTYIKPYVSEEVLKDTITHAKGTLEELIEDAKLGGQPVVRHVLKGGVQQQILLLTEKLSPAYIVLNSSGPDAMNGMTGPVTAQISRYAPCNVLIVR